MKCEICGQENNCNNKKCVKCGNPLTVSKIEIKDRNLNDSEIYGIRKVFGFRRNNLFFKILATIYYIMVFFMTYFIIWASTDVNLDTNMLYLYFLLIMHSPWILFSDFTFSKVIRKQKNLAKKNFINNIIFYIKFTGIYFIIMILVANIF